jgi:hypothetical protein
VEGKKSEEDTPGERDPNPNRREEKKDAVIRTSRRPLRSSCSSLPEPLKCLIEEYVRPSAPLTLLSISSTFQAYLPVGLTPSAVLAPAELATPTVELTACSCVVGSVSLTTTTEVEEGVLDVVGVTAGVLRLVVLGVTAAAEVVRMAADVVGVMAAAEVVVGGVMAAAEVVLITAAEEVG